MTASLRIAGSLWSAGDAAPEEAARLAAAGLTRLHWDVTDGEFTLPGGFLPKQAQAISSEVGVMAEAHLMVREPLQWIDPWTEFCDVVAIHVESHRWVDAARRIARRGCTPVLAVSPGTDLATLEAARPSVLEFGVLVMSIQPGHAGKGFDPAVVERVRSLQGLDLLGVDGSVTVARARELVDAGATWVVSGTDLLRAPDPAKWLARTAGS